MNMIEVAVEFELDFEDGNTASQGIEEEDIFPLLDLPWMVQLEIWTLLLRSHMSIENPASRFDRRSRIDCDRQRLDIHPNIILANRSVYGDANPLLYKLNHFVFAQPYHLDRFSAVKGFHFIQKLTLGISNNYVAKEASSVAVMNFVNAELPRNPDAAKADKAERAVRSWTKFFAENKCTAVMPTSIKLLRIQFTRKFPYSLAQHLGFVEPPYFTALVDMLGKFLGPAPTDVDIVNLGNLSMERRVVDPARNHKLLAIHLAIAKCHAEVETESLKSDDQLILARKTAVDEGHIRREILMEISDAEELLKKLERASKADEEGYTKMRDDLELTYELDDAVRAEVEMCHRKRVEEADSTRQEMIAHISRCNALLERLD